VNNELLKAKEKRKLWHMLATVFCIIMLLNKIVFYANGYILSTEDVIVPFVFIGMFTWCVVIGATLIHGVVLKDFDSYTKKKLERADESWRIAGNISAVATLNPSLYVGKNSNTNNYAENNGIHKGARKWNAIVIFLVGIVPTIMDTLVIAGANEKSGLILLTFFFIVCEMIFAIATKNWNEENTYIANGKRTKYPGRVLVAYIVCLVIGNLPYCLFLVM